MLMKNKKIFDINDENKFSFLSGDFNPIHINEEIARRQLFGEIIVHGIHVIMYAIDQFILENINCEIELLQIKVKFTNPVFLSKEIHFILEKNESKAKIFAKDSSDAILTEIVFEYSATNHIISNNYLNCESYKFHQHNSRTINDFIGLSEHLEAKMNNVLCEQMFPNAYKFLDKDQIVDLLTISRLVGMQCPGLYSLFSSFDFSKKSEKSTNILYNVTKVNSRFSLLYIECECLCFAGVIQAFLRPQPFIQPSIDELMSKIPNGIYKNMKSLIIGGSRGIGETTAKIISGGGGYPLITYFKGKEEAILIKKQLDEKTLQSEIFYLDTSDLSQLDEVLINMNREQKLNSIFYFPTPKIAQNKTNTFDQDLYMNYFKVYVTNFILLYNKISELFSEKIIIFYPSTIFITDETENYTEYILAKMAAEYQIKNLNKKSNNIEVLVSRLPKIKSDQTISLFETNAIPAFNAILPILSEINSNLK